MARKLCALTAAGVLLFGLGIGCGSPLSAAGSGCSADADCAAGLSCFSIAQTSQGQCVTQSSLCSKECHVDRDCIAVGPQFKCIARCNGASACIPTE